MYWITHYSQKDNKWGITDTLDSITEWYSMREIHKIVKAGIPIQNYDIVTSDRKGMLAKLTLMYGKDFQFWDSEVRGICCTYIGEDAIVKVPRGVNCLFKIDSTSVEELYLPDTLCLISSDCCENKYRLGKVSFPNRPYAINERAFRGCGNLEEVDLSNCFYLGYLAFKGAGLRKVHSFDSIDILNTGVFSECNNLTEIPSLENVRYICGDFIEKTKVKCVEVYAGTTVRSPILFKFKIRG